MDFSLLCSSHQLFSIFHQEYHLNCLTGDTIHVIITFVIPFENGEVFQSILPHAFLHIFHDSAEKNTTWWTRELKNYTNRLSLLLCIEHWFLLIVMFLSLIATNKLALFIHATIYCCFKICRLFIYSCVFLYY